MLHCTNFFTKYESDLIVMENRRRYPRYEIEFEARIFTENLNHIVTVVDISEGGIGIISEEPIQIGTKLAISFYPIIENPIEGKPLWSSYIKRHQKYYHRIGIETEHLALGKIRAFGFPINSKLVQRS